jgi:ABC-type antimicrobial peptide transport system permease subunit
MREILDRSTARISFTLVMLAIAGAMALALGLIGIYGVIAYAVAQRTREMGIRIALGAEPVHVRRVFVRYGLGLCVFGIAIGLGAAAMLTRAMRSLLFGVTPVDPLTFAAVPLTLLLAAFVACYLPARKASRVDPIECMRAE